MRYLALLFALCSACAQGPSRPGRFDYYVLSLSWSPQHCSTPAADRDRIQCAGPRKYGFIVHGLWPQYERGWPEDCSTEPGPSRSDIDAMLDIIPSPGLIRHEWRKHGTCSGLNARGYMAKIREAWKRVKIPADYQAPPKQITVRPSDIEAKFAAANPGMTAAGIGIQCSGNQRFLQEVRVCLDKDLKPRACGADIRDCRSSQIIMQPLR